MIDPMLVPWSIPSPSQGVWHLGPVPIRAYALCIILGVFVAVWYAERRWIARGGQKNEIADLAMVAVPAGLIGARAWHVATDYELYFGEGRDPWGALRIWEGGLGIWGAIMGGVLGAWWYARRRGFAVGPLLDSAAPAILIAQAIGRLGNYFNQELFGRPTERPWALEIDQAHRPEGYEQFSTFHPTFLYELLWALAAAALIAWADRRFRLGHGRVFALYVMTYTLGRGWIEDLRIDPVQIDDVGGLRLNVWTSIVLFTLSAAYFVWARRKQPGRETSVYRNGGPTEPKDDSGAESTSQIASENDAETASNSDPKAARKSASDTPAEDSGPAAPKSAGSADRG